MEKGVQYYSSQESITKSLQTHAALTEFVMDLSVDDWFDKTVSCRVFSLSCNVWAGKRRR